MIGHTGGIEALAVLVGPDGQPLLASASSDRTVRLWDPDTGRAVGQRLTGHTKKIWALAVLVGSGKRSFLVSAGDDRTVRLWDPTTGRQLRQLQTGMPIHVLARAGDALAVAGNDGLFVAATDLTSDEDGDLRCRPHR